MSRHFTFFVFFFLSASGLWAQVVSGPMLGQVELRDARVWLEVASSVKKVQLVYHPQGQPAASQTITYTGALGGAFNPITLEVGGLEPGTTYDYRILLNGKKTTHGGQLTTKPLWQWRTPAPDFSFLAGSCAYFNEPAYDRPGKPYGGDSSIFETMGREQAAFMLWLGDNWYTREVDFFSRWGLWYRAQHDRRQPVLQDFLKAMPHYATWDDHDFGPNNSGRSYHLKEESKKVFDAYWANPSSGEGREGVYTQFSYGDVDVFLTDGRWWRSADRMADSVDGRPNGEKELLGPRQLQWLKNALLNSSATFKLVVVGSQVLNPVSPHDRWRDFSAEYGAFMDFLAAYRIPGVVFVSGDRHHSEVIRVERPGNYALYDITVSPLTSGTHRFSRTERDNPFRVVGVDEKQNYGRFTVSGPRGQRRLQVEFLGVRGETLGQWSVGEAELKAPPARQGG